MTTFLEITGAIAQVGTLLTLVFGGFKLYYVLYEHPPHTHSERGKETPLTTDGINYPRGTKSNRATNG